MYRSRLETRLSRQPIDFSQVPLVFFEFFGRKTDLIFMTLNFIRTADQLDYVFPFFVLGYGAIVTFVLNMPPLMKHAEARLPQEWAKQLQTHRILALGSLFFGSLWSLQNIWFG